MSLREILYDSVEKSLKQLNFALREYEYESLSEREKLDRACKKIAQIRKYCMPAIDRMWGAQILGIILDCDYKDVEQKLREME